MTAEESSREAQRLWRELRRHLVRSLGRNGAASWLAFVAMQMEAEARRDSIEITQPEWTP